MAYFRQAPRRLLVAAMLAGSALITASSVAYFDADTLAPFVIEKLPVRFEALWLFSLKLHVVSAALSFPLCLLLVTRTLQRRRTLHRWLGRVAGVVLLFGLVPSGAVLAFDAKGGAPVAAGFLLSGGIVALGVVAGVLAARRRDLVSHRRAMLHVVAQMSVAVWSRALMVALDAASVEPGISYAISLWAPVLLCVAFAELASRRAGPLRPLPSIERIKRDHSTFISLSRSRAWPRLVTRSR